MPVPSATSRQITAVASDPLEVEVEDRPPGGVALEEDLLARVQLGRHGRQSNRGPGGRGPPSRAYAGADVDRQGRAADHRPRAARAVRLPAARAARRGRGRHRCSGPVRPPAPARGRGRARRAQRAAAGAPGRADRGARGGRRAGAGRARALGRARVLLDPGAGARAGAAAGHRLGARPDRAADRAHAPSATPAGARGARAARAARPGAAARRSSCSARRGRARRPRARRSGDRPRRAAPARAPRPGRARRASRCAGARASVAIGRRRGAGRARPGAAARRSSGSSPALDGGRRRELLLHGVTGSGKTEVYLAAAEAALERGRGAIVLVPEIGLTPAGGRALPRALRRPGRGPALARSARASAATSGSGCARGEARICVGPRSAVFAPVAGLGLIVVDEEHDASYKQEGDPRYDAREVARRRAAQTAGAVLVLGTATPRPESWLELERLELPQRVDGRSLPAVEVLDMRGRDGREGPLHPRTRAALGGAARARRQGDRADQPPRLGAVPDLPRLRLGGWDARAATSRWSSTAPARACAATTAATPSRCRARVPDCGSVTLARAGAGTERIEDELAAAVGAAAGLPPRLRQRRRRRRPPRDPRALPGGRAGVLVGTQMVAKGHDFPDVVLGVVLDADATLRFPDFRAEERTFALVAQLAGRSGRGERGGRVLVQTLAPEAEAIAHAAAPRRRRLSRRRARAPPRARLPAVLAPDPGRALAPGRRARSSAAAAGLRDGARRRAAARARSRSGPAPRFRLRGRERRQLLIKAPERGRRGRRGPRGRARGGARRAPARDRGSRSTSTRSSGRRSTRTAMIERGNRRPARARASEVEPRPTSRGRSSTEDERERRAAALAQVVTFGDPVLRSRASEVTEFGARARRRGRADGRDHARRDGRRPRRDPARRPAAPARLPGRPGRASRPRSSTRRSSGSPTSSRPPRRAASACPGSGSTSSAPLHARVSGVDVDGEPLLIEASGLEARVLQHEIDHLDGVLILDRTDARAAQGRAAGAARGRQLQPGARSRARRRVRIVYLGTSDFAAAVLRAARREPAPPGARRHAARPPPGPRAPRSRRRRPPRPPRSSGSSCCRPRRPRARSRWRADPRRRGPSSGVVCAFGQLLREPLLERARAAQRPPVAAAALARRGADRARDHGRRRAHRGRRSCGSPRASTPARSRSREALAIGDDDFGRLSRAARASSAASCWSRPSTCARAASSSFTEQDDAAATYAEKIDARGAPARPGAPGDRARAAGAGADPARRRLPRARGRRAARGARGAGAERGRARRPGGSTPAGGLRLGCGEGALRLERVQPGRRRARWPPTPTCAATRPPGRLGP